MRDGYGRRIDYMRISVTERCNLRCGYCMPRDAAPARDALSSGEILRVARLAVTLGIVRFRLTGGEPLVREDCPALAAELKALPGVERVAMTTNGLLLARKLPELARGGLDGVNISLDSLDSGRYREITGSSADGPAEVLGALESCVRHGIDTKINTVLLPENRDGLCAIAALAERFPVDVRFIELMPIGRGAAIHGVGAGEAMALLRGRWPDLAPVTERRGCGPARYFTGSGLRGRIGIIDAVSGGFCGGCNRVRLTSSGLLKPCLCYDTAVDLKPLLRGGATDGEVREALEKAVLSKPKAHCFGAPGGITERKNMNEIGG